MSGLPDLPVGWAWSTVEGVGAVQLGRQRSPEHHTGPHMRPYLRVANVFEDRIDSSDVMSMNFSPEEFDRYRLHPGDVLLNEGQSPQFLGRPALYQGEPENVAFTNSLIRFKAAEGILPEWALIVFRHHMHSGRFAQESRITTNIAHLSASRFKGVEFPVPPLNEQRRISAELDVQMGLIDVVSRALAQLPKRLNTVAPRILRMGLESASGTPKRLEDLLAEPLTNGRSVPTRDGGFPVLRLTAIRDGTVDLAQRKSGDWGADDARRWLVRQGDFLVVRGNGSLDLVGRGGLVIGRPDDVAFPDTLIRIRVDEEKCRARYLRLVWHSPTVRQQLEAAARTTAGIYKVNQGHLEQIRLPVPSLSAQDEIVSSMEQAHAGLRPIVTSAKSLSTSTSALRRSLLRLAFSGGLVSPDANDEPAELLLKRIAEDRAAAAVSVRTRKPSPVGNDGTTRRATNKETL
jgi:type I restriction enzyme S subunit